jgi:hypothetical protein
VGRTRSQGMSSRAVLAGGEDQRSTSSRMRNGGRSGPRVRRTSIRHVPESRSCSIGPRTRLWPMRSSPSCPVRCQLSRAATHVSNGMSTIRRNDSHPRTGHMPALMLAQPPGKPVRRARQRGPSAGRAPAPWARRDSGGCAGCDSLRSPAPRRAVRILVKVRESCHVLLLLLAVSGALRCRVGAVPAPDPAHHCAPRPLSGEETHSTPTPTPPA